jgi:hypothetical protein
MTPVMALAQESVTCVDQSLASLANISEPLESTTRSYAQGDVRILILSAGEPACCGVAAAVLLPDPLDGTRICRLVLPADGQGWGGLSFGPGEASYDAATGLTVPMTASTWNGGTYDALPIAIIIDQGTGRVALR